MSRIGKKLIVLPPGVSCVIGPGAVAIKGPRGELTVPLPPKVSVAQSGQELNVSVANPADSRQEAFWGLGRSLVAAAVEGVTAGFSKKLEINGVGYKAVHQGSDLIMSLGFSHSVAFPAPAGISLAVDGNIITVSGIDKQLVGETAARIRALRPVEPYKGKGIKYLGELVRRKAGKVAKGTTS